MARYVYDGDGDGVRQSRTVSGAGALTDTWVGSTPQLLQENSTSYLYGPTDLPTDLLRRNTPEG